MKWDWPAVWQRIFGLLGLGLVLVGGLWAEDLDTGAVVVIVGFFMGGNALIKTSKNLSGRKTTVTADTANVGPNANVEVSEDV